MPVIGNTASKKPIPQEKIVSNCFHCGDLLPSKPIIFDGKDFCCNGCKTVYQILSDKGLDTFYSLNGDTSANRPDLHTHQFDILEEPVIAEKFILFEDERLIKLRFFLPSIHCSACIWLLENLKTLHPGIRSSHVHFPKKELTVTFEKEALTIKELAILLNSIGYSPDLHLEKEATEQDGKRSYDRKLIIKIGVAGFCFGNIMLLSFPEYLGAEGVDTHFKQLFSGLNLLLSLPVLFFSGREYMESACKSLRSKKLNLDVPIALGMLALFSRSAFEILSGTGAGFMDSLAGLVFFLLVGRWFQDRTYRHLSFERSYKSFLPLATLVKQDEQFKPTPIEQVAPGNTLRVRYAEIIPVDGVLESDRANIDYSFVTGESAPQAVIKGQRIFAGGRVAGKMLELQAGSKVSASNLARLWEDREFETSKSDRIQRFSDIVAKYFTVSVISLAIMSGLVWWFMAGPSMASLVFSAVLIVACPCALALSAPFTFGNFIRRMASKQIYFKDAAAAERLAHVDQLIFDKTGTLTRQDNQSIRFHGEPLSPEENDLIYSLAAGSLHPLSRAIHRYLNGHERPIEDFEENPGKGLAGKVDGIELSLGRLDFVCGEDNRHTDDFKGTEVHVKIGQHYKGYFTIKNEYRPGALETLKQMKGDFPIHLLSGDQPGEASFLEEKLGAEVPMQFEQLPKDKLAYVEAIEQNGHRTAMLGDGLNDAGALRASTVGISVVDQVNTFTPASDVIMEASWIGKLDQILRFARDSKFILRASLVLSLLYNLGGLTFAVLGLLTPLIAAILMPLSSISVVLFVTGLSNMMAQKRGF